MSKSSATATASSPATGIAGVLTIVFVLCKVFAFGPIAAWSWWWVLSPLWISALIAMAVLLVIGVIAFAVILVRNR